MWTIIVITVAVVIESSTVIAHCGIIIRFPISTALKNNNNNKILKVSGAWKLLVQIQEPLPAVVVVVD